MTTDQLAEMTEEEKQIAIGRICGLSPEARPLWDCECLNFRGTNYRTEAEARASMATWCKSPEDGHVWKNGQEWSDFFPDYLNDLNAMAQAEKVLSDVQSCDYLVTLYRSVSDDCQESFWSSRNMKNILRCISAPASQRADAFLLTMLP